MKLYNLINKLEYFFPKYLAEEWDNVGLLLGDEEKEINNVLTCLEITNDVIYEAIEKNIDLIICHHPLIFNKLSNINSSNKQNKKIVKLIKNDIAVYAMHTNVDISNNGMNDWLAEVIGIKNCSILSKTYSVPIKKVYVETDIKDLNELVLLIEKYAFDKKIIDNDSLEEYEVRYNVINQKNKIKIKFLVIQDDLNNLIKLLNGNGFIDFSVYTLEDKSIDYGIGRIGTIKSIALEDFASNLKEKFKLSTVKIVGGRENVITKVGIVGGSGSKYIIDAKNNNCDVLITGDIDFHSAQLAIDNDISLIDVGHNIEIIFNDAMLEILDSIKEINVFSSEIDTDPFDFI